jgi:hypothetical protein
VKNNAQPCIALQGTQSLKALAALRKTQTGTVSKESIFFT